MEDRGLTISIIIPMYNAEHTIARTLHSILAQTDLDGVSLVIVDDHSTDRSFEVVGSIMETRIGLAGFPWSMRKCDVNGGVGEARRLGMKMVEQYFRPDYILFVDADDVLSPFAISRIRSKIAATSPDLYTSDILRVSEGGRTSIIKNDNATWFHGKAYAMTYLKRFNIEVPPLRINEDGGFNMAVAEMTNRVVRDEFSWYYWLENPTSIGATVTRNEKEIFLEFFQSVFFGFQMISRKKTPVEMSCLAVNIVSCYTFIMEMMEKGEEWVARLEVCRCILQEMLLFVDIKQRMKEDRFNRMLSEALHSEGPHTPTIPYNFSEWVDWALAGVALAE